MEELTLRIFMYGMMLFVPVDETDPTKQKEDGAHFAVLMIDDRGMHEGAHVPSLIYEVCDEDGSDCVATERVLASNNQEFERIWFEWSESTGAHSCPGGARNGVCRNDSAHGPVTGKLPTDRAVAEDFDWAVPLRQVLGLDHPAKVKGSCLMTTSGTCDEVVGRVDLKEGELRICSLVQEFEQDDQGTCDGWVREVTFVPGRKVARAVAETLVLERSIESDSLPELRLWSSLDEDQPLATLSGRKCGQQELCIDIVLVNAPRGESEKETSQSTCPKRDMVGEHFQHYARLIETDPHLMPVPVVLDGSGRGRSRDRGPDCELPAWGRPARGTSESTAALDFVEKILTAEDRAICPVGTP